MGKFRNFEFRNDNFRPARPALAQASFRIPELGSGRALITLAQFWPIGLLG